MATKNSSNFNPNRKMKTSIGNSKNSTYNKKKHKKCGKKKYRGQGK